MSSHNLFTDDQLTQAQRAWEPPSAARAYAQWPCAWRVERVGDLLIFDGAAAVWDWHSVALAARTFPGWQVELVDTGMLIVTARPARTRRA